MKYNVLDFPNFSAVLAIAEDGDRIYLPAIEQGYGVAPFRWTGEDCG